MQAQTVYSVAQAGLKDSRSVYYARGHGLGGSSSTNVMAYNRGSDDVYNNWAKLTKDDTWSWANLKSYQQKVCALPFSDLCVADHLSR